MPVSSCSKGVGRVGANEALLPAYLAVGKDKLAVRKALGRFDALLEAHGGDPSFDKEVLEGESLADPSYVRCALDTLPFGSDFRLVVVEGAGKAPKPVTEAIVSYLADPCPTTVLLLTADELAKSTRLYKAVAKAGRGAVIECAPPAARELPAQVVDMARSRGVEMGYDAASELVALVGESAAMLDNEVDKLARSLGGARRIGVEDVRRAVARTADVKPWEVPDAVSERDAGKACALYSRMRGPDDVFPCFSLMVRRLRELVCARALIDRGTPGAVAAQVGCPDWRAKRLVGWARQFTAAELSEALVGAAEVEARLKSSSDRDLVFTRWIVSVCKR